MLHRIFGHRAIVTGIVFCIASGCAAIAEAVEQKLSDLSYAGHRADGASVVIDTSGTAKLKITLLASGAARVQVVPDGNFRPNISPAVDGIAAVASGIKIEDSDEVLRIRGQAITVRIDKKHLRVDAYDAADVNSLSLETPDSGTSWNTETGAISQSRMLANDEDIFGLGEDNANHGTLNRRGTVIDMWTGQQIRSGNVTAADPVTFYLSTGADGRGYGCFVDSSWHTRFDIGKTHHDRLTWTAPGGPIDYYLFAGPSFKSIIEQYTRLTGRPSMLPLWAFGFWQSRCFFNDFPDIEKSANRLQTDGLPLDVVVVDSDWSDYEMNFKWSKKFLSGRTANEWFDDLHARGLKVIVSTKGPMIRPDADIYPEAKQLGVFADDGHGNPITAGYYSGHLLDVTSPNIAGWLEKQLTPLTKQGTDGWWLDLNEPEGEPPQAVYHGGTSADTHNRFSLLNNKMYYDYCEKVSPGSRPVILGRAATAGTQRYSGIIWTGDINSDWPTFRAHIPEAQNAGLSGLPYWTNDSGGFIGGFLNNDRYGAHAALYERWFEFTSFAPIARAHKAGPSEPYEFGPVVEATAKKYLQLRYRLMPYVYTQAHETVATGLPMLRPLVLEYQADPGSRTAKTQFMFGPDLLIAPVIWANTSARPVYFPPCDWVSYDDGFQVSGGQSIGVAAPHDRLPLFVRAGAILPMAPPMTSTGQKPWDPITLGIWPHGESAGSLYQDDGISQKFASGDFTTTTFRCVEVPGKSIVFNIEPSNKMFGPKQWIAEVHLTSVPTAVAVDGTSLPADAWKFNNDTNVLTANIPGDGVAREVKIALDGSSRPRPDAPKIDAPMPTESDTAGPQQTAQFLPPPKLPIRIEAANYDKGGEGLAFHVNKPYSTDVYRKEGVPIDNSTDTGGGYVVPGLQAGEWVAYTIDAVDGGWFTINARVRTATGGSLTLLRSRSNKLTEIAIPKSAGKSTWVDAAGEAMFYLPAGEQIITVRIDHAGVDLGHLTFAKIKEIGISAEAESGERVGTGGVQTDHPGYSGTGFVAGVQSKDDRVSIHLNAPSAGPYVLVVRYGNGFDSAMTDIAVNDQPAVHATMATLGNWSDYGEAAVPITLRAGNNTIRLSGTGQGVINLDQVRLLAPADKD